jgi:hypothetical protein
MVCSSAVEFGSNIPLELPQSLQQDVDDAGASSFTRHEFMDVSDLNVGTKIQNTRCSLDIQCPFQSHSIDPETSIDNVRFVNSPFPWSRC